MPSYLEKEQILALPPYIANASAILNTFQTKVQYWGAGAARVKNAANRYMNLELSREDNQNNLRGFMETAKTEMQKTIRTDLSVGDNQTRALNIFDPLVNGKTDFSKNILGDNRITEHYQNQLRTAESFRTRNEGKEYSDTNVAYLTQHLEDFRNESNPDSWKKYYSTKRSYTPYYDYNKEIRELMEAYEPNKASEQQPSNGMYFHSLEDKSVTSADAQRYITANLSQKAKNQMGIEGSVNWHGRDSDLIPSVKADWDSDISKYTSYSKDLEARIRLERDPVAKAELEKEKTLVQKRIGNLNDNIDRYARGDMSEIINNKETYANKLYTNNLLSSISTGYARTDYTEKYTPDSAAIAQMNETGRNLREVARMEFEKGENKLDRETSLEIARMRSESKSTHLRLGIPGIGDRQTGINLTEDDKKNFTLSTQTLNDNLATENESQKSIYSTIHDRLVSAGKITKTDDPDLRVKLIDTYLKDVDTKYQDFAKVVKDPGVLKTLMEREYFPGIMEAMEGLKESNQVIYSIKAIKDKIAESTLVDLQGLAQTGGTTVNYMDRGNTTGVFIDPQVLSNYVFKGDRSVIKETMYSTPGMVSTASTNRGFITYGQPRATTIPVKGYAYNGRILSTDEFQKLVSKVNGLADKRYDTSLVENKNVWSIDPLNKDKMTIAKQQIMNTVTIGSKDKELKESDYQVIGYSEDGMIYFKSSADVEGGKKISKDFDGRTIYSIPTDIFKIDVNSALPPNAKGLKYFFDKQTPFLKPGTTLSTPADKNFFQVGDIKYRVVAERNVDGAIVYNLYEKSSDADPGRFLTRQYDFYSLVEFANKYPQVKPIVVK